MAKVAQIPSRSRPLGHDRVPNASGLVLCMAIAVPLWAGILALVF